jgi:hypothetical protein
MTQSEAEAIKELLQQQMGDIKTDLDEIKEQTTLTNGRVKQLELRQERQKGWLQVLGLFVPVITGVMLWAVVERVLV